MIRTAHIPELAATPLGLRAKTLSHLGQVVLLAGPNGGGKSRYLRLLFELVKSATEFQKNAGIAASLGTKVELPNPYNIDSQIQKFEDTNVRLLTFTNQSKVDTDIKQAKCTIHFMGHSEFSAFCKPILLSYEDFSKSSIQIREHLTISGWSSCINSIDTGKMKSLYQAIHVYIGNCAQAIYNSEHPIAKHQTNPSLLQAVNSFNQVTEKLIGTTVEYQLDNNLMVFPKLFGRRFVASELSDGQLILLAWAIAFNEHNGDFRNSIIFIDEPEVHLHADMCIEALERLRTDFLGEHGQLWIATHSPSIIAHFGVDSLYHVKDGSIEYAGAGKVVQVMDSILGGEVGREKLATVLLDAEHVAFAKFAAECILPATVAEHQSDDPQAQQFVSALSRRLKEPAATVRILDYAAGKGRFATALAEQSRVIGTDWLNRIEYHAYNDPKHTPNEVADKCKQALGAFCGAESVAERYWDSMADLKAKQAGKIDLVILSNVLHEIDINSWPKVFLDIANLFSEHGSLLVIEDLLPPVGELPNMWGYIILDQCGFEVLFDKVDLIEPGPTYKDRLLAIEVSRQNVAAVGKEKMKKALTHLRDKSEERISSLRNTDTNKRDHKTGRQHAHYTMLYTSASMALTAIK